MIGPKRPKPSKADEKDAYELATLRDRNTCQRCRRDCGPIARDHRQNRQGGNTVVSNLQCLGLLCHQWKTENARAAIEQGWAVSRYQDPAEWPAARYFSNGIGGLRLGWCLYDDVGGVQEINEAEAHQRMKGG